MNRKNEQTVKIVVIGPMGSGKSTISNFIAEMPEVLNPNYHPTVGVRVLEFEKQAPRNPKRPGPDKVLVELWDVSGDTKYDRCWPAIQKGAQGLVIVYSAENPKHESELESWVSAFPKKVGLGPQFCLGLAHHPSGVKSGGASKQPKGMSNVMIFDTSIEDGQNTIHPAFDKYFENLMLLLYEKQERDENRLMQDTVI